MRDQTDKIDVAEKVMKQDVIRALMIEDDKDFVRLIEKRLTGSKDMSVSLEATDRLSSGSSLLKQGEYDIVLLDLALPDSRGIETFLKLQTQDPKIPIVILTGIDDAELAAQAVNAGAQDYLVKGTMDAKLLKRVILHAIERHRILETWIEAWKKEHILAIHDPLSGLPNRILFHDRLNRALTHARRHQTSVAVIMLDLDQFKTINDSFGHAVGDLVIKVMAERMNICVREADTVARLGGDEFVILLDDIHDANDVTLVCERLRKELTQPLQIGAHALLLSASMGISIYPADGEDPEALLHHADMAMYRAKQCGGNTYHYYLM